MISFKVQNLVHWLDLGKGRKVFTCLVVLVFILVFSGYLSYKRFSGLRTEYVIEEALVSKHLAAGDGFATSVVFPQTVSLLEKRRAYHFNAKEPLPDLYHAPFYPLVMAGGLLAIPDFWEDALWEDPTFIGDVIPTGFNADYYLLGINLLFFWLGCLMVFLLGRRIFSPRAGLLSLMGMLLSGGLWEQVLSINGNAVLIFLVLVLFYLWTLLEERRIAAEEEPLPRSAIFLGLGLGSCAALIFLTEYTAVLIFIIFLGYAFFHFRRRALLKVLLPALAGFLLISAPWLARNIFWTGHPLGLAGQNIALKVGDSTAEPETFRKAMNASWPKISLRKVGGKGLKGIEDNIKTNFWSGGAYLFTAFFLTGCLYRFRNRRTNNLRWNAAFSILMLLFLQPFFNSGESTRLPASYMAPLVIIFGSGFFLILLESTGRRSLWAVNSCSLALLAAQGFPLGHDLLGPKQVPFTYPPYVPSLLVKTRTILTDRFLPGYGIMSDIPAGTAWYSQQPVWAQPEEYKDFVSVLLRQDIGALFLSPKVLDRPYFTQLLRADLDSGGKYRETRYWGVVYGGLQERKIPPFFPLQVVQQLTVNMYVLLNPLAWKGG